MASLSIIQQALGPTEGADPAPLYMRLAEAIRQAIGGGLLRQGSALPPERELATELAISRITVRKALDCLVSEGLLVRRQGAGTFVTSRVEKQFAKLSSFTEDMAARGWQASTRWLARHESAVSPDEALNLGLSPGSRVYRFHRLRLADTMPMALEHATIAGFALPSEEAVEDSLYAALETSGFRPARALQRLRAVLFTAEQARLLRVEPGSPGLFIERRGYLDDGRTVELTQSWYRGDAYDFVAELSSRE